MRADGRSPRISDPHIERAGPYVLRQMHGSPHDEGSVARSIAVTFLWLQAGLVGGWWVAMWRSPAVRAEFVFGDWPEDVVFAFFVPDLVMLVLGAAIVAVALQREKRWAMYAFAAVLGGALYATLFCVAAQLSGNGNPLALTLMALLTAADATAFGLARSHRVTRKRTAREAA